MKKLIIAACLLIGLGLQSCYVSEENGHRHHHWGHRRHYHEVIVR